MYKHKHTPKLMTGDEWDEVATRIGRLCSTIDQSNLQAVLNEGFRALQIIAGSTIAAVDKSPQRANTQRKDATLWADYYGLPFTWYGRNWRGYYGAMWVNSAPCYLDAQQLIKVEGIAMEKGSEQWVLICKHAGDDGTKTEYYS